MSRKPLTAEAVMMPIGPMMIEHRLIERMLAVARRKLEGFARDKRLDPEFVRELVEFIRMYAAGDQEAFVTVLARLNALADFYPRHIEKEDKHFFLPVMRCFSDEEKQAMLREGYDFDATLIHERYRQVVERLEADSE